MLQRVEGAALGEVGGLDDLSRRRGTGASPPCSRDRRSRGRARGTGRCPGQSARFMWTKRHVELERRHGHQLLAVFVGRLHELQVGIHAQDVRAEPGARGQERQAAGPRLAAPTGACPRRARAPRRRRPGAPCESAAPAGSSPARRSRRPASARDLRRAQEPDVGPAVGDHGEVSDAGAQDLADHRHRLAPGAPAPDSDGHSVPELADCFGGGRALVHGGNMITRRIVSVQVTPLGDLIGSSCETGRLRIRIRSVP